VEEETSAALLEEAVMREATLGEALTLQAMLEAVAILEDHNDRRALARTNPSQPDHLHPDHGALSLSKRHRPPGVDRAALTMFLRPFLELMQSPMSLPAQRPVVDPPMLL
jgi:hypothetical protein